MTRDIPALTGLRGLAVLWVFAFHAKEFFHGTPLWAAMQRLGGAGDLGVDVFFVLSGFVLAHNYADAHRSGGAWASFLWKRLARIYPVHVVALAIVGVLIWLGVYPAYQGLDGLPSSLALMHAWTFPIGRTINTVSWPISCEWAAYIAFPLVAAFAAGIRSPRLVLAFVALLVVALHVNTNRFFGYPGSMAYGLWRIGFEFPIGVLLYRLWTMHSGRERFGGSLVALGLGALFIGCTLLAPHFYKSSLFALAAAGACLTIYGLASSSGVIVRTLSSPGWQYAGRVSYAFYMVHGFIIGSITLKLRSGSSAWWGVALTVLAFALTAAVAHVLHVAVEQPARRWMLARQPRNGLTPEAAKPRVS